MKEFDRAADLASGVSVAVLIIMLLACAPCVARGAMTLPVAIGLVIGVPLAAGLIGMGLAVWLRR